jgi:hypothetical protein
VRETSVLNIDIKSFPEPGLYLLLPDGGRLTLTREAIESTTRRMLDDPDCIPKHVRAAADYHPCDICPARFTAEICHAIMVALPFFDDIDRYMSYDMVTAVYREDEEERLVVCHTRMSDALQFVTILSMTEYCEVGSEYGAFFEGINPLMPVDNIGREVFRNVCADCGGKIECIRGAIKEMSANLFHVAQCQTRRLNLISKRDAFVNAYVTADLIFHFVNSEFREYAQKFETQV